MSPDTGCAGGRLRLGRYARSRRCARDGCPGYQHRDARACGCCTYARDGDSRACSVPNTHTCTVPNTCACADPASA